MKDLRLSRKFKKDQKRVAKRGLNLDLLDAVVELLREGETLPPSYRDHALQGDWVHWRECHIRPDWLLIYKTDDDEVVLGATGSHADLFE